jgi:hypothetical protein
MPTLRELDAVFIGRCGAKAPGSFHELGDAFTPEVQGLLFYCPLHHDPVKGHTHCIVVWFAGRGVPDNAEPKTRWGASGTSLDDLTLQPSINLDVPWVHPDTQVRYPSSCKWHGFITKGVAT